MFESNKRYVSLDLKTAKEWYAKGGDLRTVALQAFSEEELTKLCYHDLRSANTNGHKYVDLGLPSGALWAKFNVGAMHGHTKESWYGSYLAWGEVNPKKNYTWSTLKYDGGNKPFEKYDPRIDDLIELQLSDDAAHANMGGDWHMPNNLLYWELISNTTNEWVTDYQGVTGLNGRVFTSKINGATLFIPAAGYWNGSSLYNDGTLGLVWYSTLDSTNPNSAMFLVFYSGACGVSDILRRNGYSVRAVIY